MGEKRGQALSWWAYLSEEEKDMLVEFLYGMDLLEYFTMDEDGKLLGRR